MRYRSFEDRKVSAWTALCIIAVFGIVMTSVILHVISSVHYFDTELSEVTD